MFTTNEFKPIFNTILSLLTQGMDEIEVEDPDEFEEEELMILEDLPDNDNDNDNANEISDNNGHEDEQQDVGYADEDYCDGDSADEEGEAFYEDDDFDGEFVTGAVLDCIYRKIFFPNLLLYQRWYTVLL